MKEITLLSWSSVDLKKLPASFARRKWPQYLITKFFRGCDPCGENGEMHTVVVGGPMFREAVPIKIGGVFEQNGFAYADIIPLN